MKQHESLSALYSLVFLLMLCASTFMMGQNGQDYIEFKGKILDKTNERPIPEAHILVEGSDLEGLTNANGVFSLKVPKALEKVSIEISKLGYDHMNFELVYYEDNFTEIKLNPSGEQLDEVELYDGGKPIQLVRDALKQKNKSKAKVTGFYREKIKRGRRNVMLAEAVVEVDENKWGLGRRGRIDIFKSRKNTDYKRLDTVAVKVRGGPYAGIYLDLIRYPEYLFAEDTFDEFKFTTEAPTTIDERYIYVVGFEEKDKEFPWYHGKLYIDAKTKGLVKADFSLNVDNKAIARRMLLVKNPKHAIVTPLETRYQVNYIRKDDNWVYSYGHFQIKLRVNWKNRIFNRRFSIDGELVITDRNKESVFPEEELTKIKPSFIMSDDTSGFGDKEFWGTSNIIEPDKSLEKAINTIQKNIKRN